MKKQTKPSYKDLTIAQLIKAKNQLWISAGDMPEVEIRWIEKEEAKIDKELGVLSKLKGLPNLNATEIKHNLNWFKGTLAHEVKEFKNRLTPEQIHDTLELIYQRSKNNI